MGIPALVQHQNFQQNSLNFANTLAAYCQVLTGVASISDR